MGQAGQIVRGRPVRPRQHVAVGVDQFQHGIQGRARPVQIQPDVRAGRGLEAVHVLVRGIIRADDAVDLEAQPPVLVAALLVRGQLPSNSAVSGWLLMSWPPVYADSISLATPTLRSLLYRSSLMLRHCPPAKAGSRGTNSKNEVIVAVVAVGLTLQAKAVVTSSRTVDRAQRRVRSGRQAGQVDVAGDGVRGSRPRKS